MKMSLQIVIANKVSQVLNYTITFLLWHFGSTIFSNKMFSIKNQKFIHCKPDAYSRSKKDLLNKIAMKLLVARHMTAG